MTQTETAASGPDEADLLEGLTAAPQKWIAGKYLWDEIGSGLFDQICNSAEYYPMGRECAILEANAGEIAAWAGPGASLVEFGSGASRKTRILLDTMQAPALYIPIDISGEFLARAAASIQADYKQLQVMPLCADYSRSLSLPPLPSGRAFGFFPGIAIGNFHPDDASAFLQRARGALGPDSLLLAAIDSTTDAATLKSAYQDSAGLMATFHLNVLRRLRSLSATNPPTPEFRHELRILHDPFRVEAHLVAQRRHEWRLSGQTVRIGSGESIRTDFSFKYEPGRFAALARAAGWQPVQAWADDQTRISLQLLRS